MNVEISENRMISRDRQVKTVKPIALIVVGNLLRGDDGISAVVCNALAPSLLSQVCHYDLGTYTNLIGQCLVAHRAAVIVDATCNRAPAGTVSIVDLVGALHGESSLNIESCHGFSVLDELRLVERTQRLPENIIFFGIEIESASWGQQISDSLGRYVPILAEKLGVLLDALIEIHKPSRVVRD